MHKMIQKSPHKSQNPVGLYKKGIIACGSVEAAGGDDHSLLLDFL
jgi:hypothetical protein